MKVSKYIEYAKDVEIFSCGIFTKKDIRVSRANSKETKQTKAKAGISSCIFGRANLSALMELCGSNVMDETDDFVAVTIFEAEDGQKSGKETVSLESIVISPALWAFALIRNKSGFLKKEELEEKLRKDIFGEEDKAIFLDEKFMAKIALLSKNIIKSLKLPEDLFLLDDKKTFHRIDGNILTDSFFMDDLSTIPLENRLIRQFLEATNPQYERKDGIEIDSSPESLMSILSKEAFPLGKWPSPHNPSLMQQVAINIAISRKEPIFSVNGPPGTGKTTLLKEIIADAIVRRADVIAGFKTKEKPFRKVFLKNDQDSKKYYYELDESLSSFGILVVSSNNAAVENVTKELPKRPEQCLCPEELDSIDYFSEVANTLIENNKIRGNCWGLISIALGKTENINKALEALKGISNDNETNNTLEQYLEMAGPDFKRAKAEYVKAKEDVIKMRDAIVWPYTKKMAENAAKTKEIIRLRSLKERNLSKRDKEDIMAWEEAQEAALGNDESFMEYNRQRERLFWKALSLHKAFLTGNEAFKDNLENFYTSLKYPATRDEQSYSSLLNTFFLVCPVVSTTFASASRMLEKTVEGKISTLIVDEAGQALPYFALGSLFRSRNAIIVGDPFQIEPVMTLPDCVDDFLRLHHGLGKRDRNMPLDSVQTVADRQSYYYGTRKFTQNRLRIGCPLIVHRRCLDPMFSISNSMAYQNIMINCTKNDGKKPDGSKWIQIAGRENKQNPYNRSIDEQIEKVVALLKEKKSWDDLFVISPFISVVNSITRKLKAEKISLDGRIGTVHTFQGKEADEVILVLGCDSSSVNFAKWAADTPNLLNVAISRAKKEIIVIGDKNVWDKTICGSILIDALESQQKDWKLSFSDENGDWKNYNLAYGNQTIRIGWNAREKRLSKPSSLALSEISEDLSEAVKISLLDEEGGEKEEAVNNASHHEMDEEAITLIKEEGNGKWRTYTAQTPYGEISFRCNEDGVFTKESYMQLIELDKDLLNKIRSLLKKDWKENDLAVWIRKENGEWINLELRIGGDERVFHLGWNTVKKKANSREERVLSKAYPKICEHLKSLMSQADSAEEIKTTLIKEGLYKENSLDCS